MPHRRFSHPNCPSNPPEHEYYQQNQVPTTANEERLGGSYDENDPYPPDYGHLENATLRSEISMSVVTDDTRFYTQDRRRSFLRRLAFRNMGDDDETTIRRRQKCGGLVNVEPVIFLLALSIGIIITSQPLFSYWARCVEIASTLKENLDDNVTAICSQLSQSNGSLQDIVERDLSQTKIYLQIISSAPTVLIAPIIGTWSDRKGRKTPLLFTLSGFVGYTILQFISTITYETSNIYIWQILAELSMGVTGGMSSVFALTIAIVTDDCRHKLKPGSSTVPVRIGAASFTQSFGSLLGTCFVSLISVPALVSATQHSQSYVIAAFVSLVLSIMCWFYAFFFVSETHFPKPSSFEYQQFDNETSTNSVAIRQPEVPERGNYIKSLLEVVTQKRPGWTRTCICLSLFFVFIEFLALDNSLLLLLVKRPPFSWSDNTFSNYSLAKGLLLSLGMVLCPLSLTMVHWLGKDSIMIIVGMSASCISFFLISQAQTTQAIFVAAGLALLCGGIAPGYRSFLPRMVPKEETARLLTLCSIIMAFCPIISSAVFNTMYNATLDWWPGFSFFVGALFQVVAVMGQIFVHVLMRPQWMADKALREEQRWAALDDDVNDEAAPSGLNNDVSQSNTTICSDRTLGPTEDDMTLRP